MVGEEKSRCGEGKQKHRKGAFVFCVRTHILIEKTGGANRPFFEDKGVQNRVIVFL